MLRKSRALMAVAGAASAALALAMAPAAAEAAPATLKTCVALTCNGQVAANYTCVTDAEIIYNVDLTVGSTVIGNLQLKWSPSCHASWARVVTEHGGVDPYTYVFSSDSKANYTYSCPPTGQVVTGCNTDMVDDLNPLTSFAYGQVYLGSSGASAFTGSWLHGFLLSFAFNLTFGPARGPAFPRRRGPAFDILNISS